MAYKHIATVALVTVFATACSAPAFAPPVHVADYATPSALVDDPALSGGIEFALDRYLALSGAWEYAWVARGDDGTTLWFDGEDLHVVDAAGEVIWGGLRLEDYMAPGYVASEGVAVTAEWIAWIGGDGDDLFAHDGSLYAVSIEEPHEVIAVPLGADGPDGNIPAPDARFHVTLLGDHVYWQEMVESSAPRGNGAHSVAIFRHPLRSDGLTELVAADAWYPTIDRCAPPGTERLVYIHDDLSSLASTRSRSVEAIDLAGPESGTVHVLWSEHATTKQIMGAAACGQRVVVGGVDRPTTAESEAFLEWGKVFITIDDGVEQRTLFWQQPETMANTIACVSANADGAAFRVSGLFSEGRDYWWSWTREPVYLTGFADTSAILQTGPHDVAWWNATDWAILGPWIVARTDAT